MKVLVVDDSAIMRRVIEQILNRLGHTAVQAGDGREALLRLSEHPDVGLILLDWNMPRMNGLELLHALPSDTRRVPTIVLTTEAERRKMIQAIEAGARLYMTKPFAAETLAAKIAQCLALG